jgi:hypothetical protein
VLPPSGAQRKVPARAAARTLEAVVDAVPMLRRLRHSMPGRDILPRIIVLYVRIFFDLSM